MSDQLGTIADEVFRSHLTVEDLYTRRDAESFVICFNGLTRQQAEERTSRIVTDIRQKLVAAAPEYSAIRVEHTVDEVDVGRALEDESGPMEAIARQLLEIREDVSNTLRKARKYLRHDARVIYRPAWNCKTESIEIHLAHLDDASGSNLFNYLKIISDPSTLVELSAEIDAVVLGKAVSAAHRALREGHASMVMIPVNYNTLNRMRSRQSYLGLCRDIPDGYRKFIVFEIYGMAESAPRTRVLELVQALKPFGKGLFVQLPQETGHCGWLVDKGVAGISLDLAGAQPQTIERLRPLVQTARTGGLKVMGHRVRTRGIGTQAMVAGFHFLDGDAVSPSETSLKGRHRVPALFDRSDVPGDLHSWSRDAPMTKRR